MKNNSIVYLFISLLAFVIISCNTTEPVENIYHNKILFTSSRSGKSQLYIMDPDGTNIMQLTNGQYWHNNGRWSPDASKIVCNTQEGTTSAGTKMLVMNSNGSNRKLIGDGNQMSWSPNGEKIAFINNYPSQLYIVNSDGMGKKTITDCSLDKIIGSICWAANNKIYFVSNRHDIENPLGIEIYNTNENGTDVERITYTKDGYSGAVSISPSGKKIAFISTMNNADKASIYVSDIDLKNIILVVTPPNNMSYGQPRFSPDEKHIIFTADFNDGLNNRSIYKVGIEGKNLTKLIDDANYPDWSK